MVGLDWKDGHLGFCLGREYPRRQPLRPIEVLKGFLADDLVHDQIVLGNVPCNLLELIE